MRSPQAGLPAAGRRSLRASNVLAFRHGPHSYTDLPRSQTPESRCPERARRAYVWGRPCGGSDDNNCIDGCRDDPAGLRTAGAREGCLLPPSLPVRLLHQGAGGWWAWGPFHSESDPGQPCKVALGIPRALWHQVTTHRTSDAPCCLPTHPGDKWSPGRAMLLLSTPGRPGARHPSRGCHAPSRQHSLRSLTAGPGWSPGKVPRH